AMRGFFNGTVPTPTYSMIVCGCTDGKGGPAGTEWWSIAWDADVPPNTALSLQARSGNTPMPDQSWGGWTMEFAMSPADLQSSLVPNEQGTGPPPGAAGAMRVDLTSRTVDRPAPPKLKPLDTAGRCPPGP